MKKIVVAAFTLSLFWVASGQVAWSKSIRNIRLDPPAPSSLVFGQEVNVSFDYQKIHTSGLRIFVRPYSGQNPSPRYTAEGSPSYPSGNGHGSGSFTIEPDDPVTVDAIKISVYGDNGRDLLFEFFLPVKYAFKSERMALNRHLEITPAEPLRTRESRPYRSPHEDSSGPQPKACIQDPSEYTTTRQSGRENLSSSLPGLLNFSRTRRPGLFI